jgi:hypothetical protein
MNLQTALQAIHAPKGVTSIIEGISAGDFSVLKQESSLTSSLNEIIENVSKYEKQLNECKSDWAYWAILGDLAYWEASRDIVKAATLVGEDNLPDIPVPDLAGCVVMDAIGRVQEFGANILTAAKLSVK